MAVILVVEDEEFIRELVEMTIQDWGYDTLSAGDAHEALLLLRSSQDIDVMFTDIYLKTEIFGGCELAHKAVALRPRLCVLYTTGNYAIDKISDQFVEGARCLRKPYMPDQLHGALKDLLAA